MKYFLEGEGLYRRPTIVIKIDTQPTPHYTNVIKIQTQLLQAFRKNATIKLITESCHTGDRGFAAFEILDRGQAE